MLRSVEKLKIFQLTGPNTLEDLNFEATANFSHMNIYKHHLIPHLFVQLSMAINPLNAELNLICYLLALLAHHFLHVSRIRFKPLTLRLLMSYIYGAHILDVSRSHTTTHHSR